LSKQNQADPAEPEHHSWISIGAVHKSPKNGQREVLIDRQRPDVPDPPAVQVAGGRMMHRVISPPLVKWYEGENADQSAGEVVHRA
jgi:hypothetical protein